MSEDFSEVFELVKDLTDATEKANRNIDKALKFTSVEIKKDWGQGAEATGLDSYAASIDFDMHYSSNEIASEIGPNMGRKQGTFGFVEDANGGVKSAPQHAGRNALEANEADFIRGLEIAVFDATAEAIEKG